MALLESYNFSFTIADNFSWQQYGVGPVHLTGTVVVSQECSLMGGYYNSGFLSPYLVGSPCVNAEEVQNPTPAIAASRTIASTSDLSITTFNELEVEKNLQDSATATVRSTNSHLTKRSNKALYNKNKKMSRRAKYSRTASAYANLIEANNSRIEEILKPKGKRDLASDSSANYELDKKNLAKQIENKKRLMRKKRTNLVKKQRK